MKILSIFNNKGGVGKTTLTYHLGHILADMGKKVLMIDLDPQCNLSIYSVFAEEISKIWANENDFIKDFKTAKIKIDNADFQNLIQKPRSIHFLLAPTEQGESDIETLPPPYPLTDSKIPGKLDLVIGRLSVYTYESSIVERWSKAMLSDPLALRTIFKIRGIAQEYSRMNGYDFVLIDTSPSLGALNKVIISTVDGFLIPCLPDLFSLYGIQNIGEALKGWKEDFDIMRLLLKPGQKEIYNFSFVKFLGYTIFNAKKYTGVNDRELAQGNNYYAEQIAQSIQNYIASEIAIDKNVHDNIGGKSIIHTHNTHPNFAQRLKTPIWNLANYDFDSYTAKYPEESEDIDKYRQTQPLRKQDFDTIKQNYTTFANDLLERVKLL